MKLINYLKKEYPNENPEYFDRGLTDGNGRYGPDINDGIEEYQELLHDQDTGGLTNIIDYYIDWDKLQYDAECNGELIHLSDLNLENDEVNEFGELI